MSRLFVVPSSLVLFVLVFSLCSVDSNVDLWLKWTLKRVIRSNYSDMVAEQCGFVARKVCHAEVAEDEQKVEEPSAGVLVEQNLVADGFEKAVGCRRATGL